jgi:23S rRNA (uracil1939-C5)-methyltransferase
LDNGVCLVPFAVPGDILDVEFSKEGEVSFGWIRNIIQPSPYRRSSRCPVFGICGGCDFDNMEYQMELQIKKDILVEDLRRIAKLFIVPFDRLEYSNEYWYRNNVQFKVNDNGFAGFFEKKSHTVIQLPEEGCRLLQKGINNYFKGIQCEIKFKKGGFRIRSNKDGTIYKKGIPGINDDMFCYYSVDGLKFRLTIDDFFQVNNFVVGKWVRSIMRYLEPDPDDQVVDLYCGSGLISLSLARSVKSVTGIELNPNAVKNARYNAGINRIYNTTFIRAKAESGFERIKYMDKVIVDPPRSGIQNTLIRRIIGRRPRVVVYASCVSSTFARDVAEFKRGGYNVESVSLIDMFPRTKHTEVVSRIVPLKD